MNQGNTFQEYLRILASWLRSLENLGAKGDPDKLQAVSEIPDTYLVKKWLWIISLVGGPACFVGLPFLLSGIHSFVPAAAMVFLWKMAKGLMGIMFILFVFAIIVTVRKSDN